MKLKTNELKVNLWKSMKKSLIKMNFKMELVPSIQGNRKIVLFAIRKDELNE